jgi:hypothetical protein
MVVFATFNMTGVRLRSPSQNQKLPTECCKYDCKKTRRPTQDTVKGRTLKKILVKGIMFLMRYRYKSRYSDNLRNLNKVNNGESEKRIFEMINSNSRQ